ncbi:hypothetical protein Tco_0969391, partial [Tanacetum coccineum]
EVSNGSRIGNVVRWDVSLSNSLPMSDDRPWKCSSWQLRLNGTRVLTLIMVMPFYKSLCDHRKGILMMTGRVFVLEGNVARWSVSLWSPKLEKDLMGLFIMSRIQLYALVNLRLI